MVLKLGKNGETGESDHLDTYGLATYFNVVVWVPEPAQNLSLRMSSLNYPPWKLYCKVISSSN